MRVCVTGATGLVGANVAREWLTCGWTVRVGVRGTSNTLAVDGLDVERVALDVEDRASLDAAFRDCDAVVHAAGAVWVGQTGRDWLWRANVEGTRNVCAAVVHAGVRRLVHVSSTDALGIRYDGVPADEDTAPNLGWLGCAYPETKIAAEHVIDEFVAGGLDAVIVQPGYMFGPWDVRPSSGTMILEIARGKGLLAPPGGNSFVDVRDVASGTRLAFERGETGRRYVLAGENLTYREMWTRIARIVGARAPIGSAPRLLVRAIGQLGGLYGSVVGKEPEINPMTARFGELPHYFDSSRARRELGFPETNVDRAVGDAWQWFRDHGRYGVS